MASGGKCKLKTYMILKHISIALKILKNLYLTYVIEIYINFIKRKYIFSDAINKWLNRYFFGFFRWSIRSSTCCMHVAIKRNDSCESFIVNFVVIFFPISFFLTSLVVGTKYPCSAHKMTAFRQSEKRIENCKICRVFQLL